MINLNKLLQQSVNPPGAEKSEYSYGNVVFREGDKVMQTKNNYDILYTNSDKDEGMGIFNGDMGIIQRISSADKVMTILFDDDRLVEYPFNQADELDLAYAVTVHKSQGSEFPIIIMPVCNFPPMLMCRNLFYTAITRAREMVVLVGVYDSVRYMTGNNQERQRYTGLCEKLIQVKQEMEKLRDEDPFGQA